MGFLMSVLFDHFVVVGVSVKWESPHMVIIVKNHVAANVQLGVSGWTFCSFTL